MSPRPDLDRAVHEVLDEGLDDWVALQSVIRVAQHAAEADRRDFRQVTRELVDRLLRGRLMIVGELGDACVDAWEMPIEDAVNRVIGQCDDFRWMPRGEGCWFANTESGDALARELLSRRSEQGPDVS